MPLPSNAIVKEELAADHALEAYANYLGQFDHNNLRTQLRYAHNFISAYPDISQWEKL